MLQGRRALITGSTSGIGLGVARALAMAGCGVMLNGSREATAVEATRRELEGQAGVPVAYHQADLTRPAEAEGLVAATVERLGGLDILVNNAGIQFTAPVEDFPPEMWDRIIALNLSSAFHTIHHALPRMKAGGWGRILNVSSVHGLVASVRKAAYVTAKHGLVGLTKVVALETAGQGITCNAICPGWTRTELIEPQIVALAAKLGVSVEEGGRALLAGKQPSGQFVAIEHLGQLAVFLCSDAAAQITGTAIPIDGGWTAQ